MRRLLRMMLPLAAITLAMAIPQGVIHGQSAGRGSPRAAAVLRTNPDYLRANWERMQRASGGVAPKDALARGLAQAQTSARASSGPRSIQAAGGGWTPLGPAPVNGGQIGATGNLRDVSGRVTALAVHPTNPNRWLAGAAQGGIWETTNAGATWTPKSDNFASLAIGAIGWSRSNPAIIYAGTGDSNMGLDTYAGQGVLKSVDGGATWTLMGSTVFQGLSIADVIVHPTNPNTVLVASGPGTAGIDGSIAPEIDGRLGMYRSDDGGITWQHRLQGVPVTSLVADPNDPNRLYAGAGNPYFHEQAGVYRSTDGGWTWNILQSGPWMSAEARIGRVELAVGSNSDTVYAGIQNAWHDGSGAGVPFGLYGLWRSDDGWATAPAWTKIETSEFDLNGMHGYCGWDPVADAAQNQCLYTNVLSVDPSKPNVLYAGGVGLWRYDGSEGGSWAEVSRTAGDPDNGIHTDQFALAWALTRDGNGAVTGTRLLAGNGGGVWSTANGGNTWDNHNTNLSITQFYAGAASTTSGNFALGAATDNGTVKYTGATTWDWVDGKFGAAVGVSSSNPTTHWAVVREFGVILRTTNGGQDFTAADGGISTPVANRPYITKLAVCPSNSDIMATGTDQVWRTANFFAPGSPTWAAMGNYGGEGFITALAFDPTDATCTRMMAADNTGRIAITSNGSTWVDVDQANQVPDRWVTDVAYDPTAGSLVATLSGFDETPGAGHVFRSVTGGSTWTNITPAGMNLPVNTVHVANQATILIGADNGIWRSDDGGAGWTAIGPANGVPNVAVYDLVAGNGGSILAFTHGRGAFRFTPAAATTTVSGTVTLQGRTTASAGGDGYGAGFSMVQVSLLRSDTAQVIATMTTNEAGAFSFVEVPAGTYTLAASAPGYLSARRTNVTVSGSAVTLPSVQLLAGKVNGDDVVNLHDLTIALGSFGQSLTSRQNAAGFTVDLDGNGMVNITDISLIIANFGKGSPQNW